MVYEKRITNAGKDEILKLAFLNDQGNAFSYCALGLNDDKLASTTEDDTAFNEFSGYQYHRVQIEQEGDIINNTLKASCIFEDDNYNTDTGEEIGEIALCNNATGEDNTTYFAFSQVPNIKKTGSVSLKYTWVIHIE